MNREADTAVAVVAVREPLLRAVFSHVPWGVILCRVCASQASVCPRKAGVSCLLCIGVASAFRS